MLKKYTLSFFLIAYLLTFSCVFSLASSKAENLESIVAVVNNQIITSSALEKHIHMAKHQAMAQHLRLPSPHDLRQEILNHMIDTKLQLSMAKRMGITVKTSDLSHAIKTLASRNHLSTSAFRHKVEESGITFSNYKKALKKQLILEKLQHAAVASHIEVTHSEIQNALKEIPMPNNPLQYHIQHILIAIPEGASKQDIRQCHKRAQSIEHELKQGKDFMSLAKKYSTGNQAGDWGWQNADALPVIFTHALQKMQAGQVSSPIKTGNGFHIIKLVKKRYRGKKQVITEYHVRHILLSVDKQHSAATQHVEIEKLRKEIIHGQQSFASIAKRYSNDPGSQAVGGSLGWVAADSLVPKFRQTMEKLKIGQLSKPVRTRFGWHLIEVLGKKQVDIAKRQRERQAKRLVFERKYNTAIKQWLTKLRKHAYIKIMS